MADASLRIPITADASKFLYTLEQVEAKLESLRASLSSAKGDDIGGFNIEIADFERQKKAIENFGKFAEGTFGSLLQQLRDLKEYQLTLKYDSTAFKEVQADIDATKAKIKDLTSTPKEIEVKFEPPQGSIAGLKKQISELEFMKSIQVDTTAIEQYANLIKGLKSELKGLQSIGVEIPAPEINEEPIANSINGIRKQIKDLEKQKGKINLDDQGEIAKLNTQIADLEDKIRKVDGVGFDKNGNISQNANKARQTLTNLKLVAQDLPFGFIAIQNNIPNLLESFSDLNTKGNGLKGALKDLGSQLVGPAGLFLGISLVTTAITVAVQEYGSLGAAVDALLGKQLPLADAVRESAKAYAEFNKEKKNSQEITSGSIATTEAEATAVRSLAGIVLTQTNSYNERNTALNKLKEIDKDYFGNLDLEKTKFEDLSIAVIGYVNSIQQAAITKGFSDELGKTSVELSKAEGLLSKLKDQLVFANAQEKVVGIAAIKIKDQKLIEQATKDYNNQKLIVDELQATFDNLNAKIDESVKKEIAIKAPIIAANEAYEALKKKREEAARQGKKSVFAPKLDVQDVDEFTNIDKLIKRVTKYGDAFIDINNSVAERTEALKKLLEVDPKYFESFSVGTKDVTTAKEAIEQFIRTLNSNKLFEKQRKEGQELNNLWAKLARDKADKLAEADDKLVEEMFRNDTYKFKFKFEFKDFDADIQNAIDKANSGFESLGEVFNSVFDDIISKNERIASSIEGYITQPMQTLFDILTNEGEASWKDFGKVVIDTLKRIAVQAISTAIAKTLANILAPGFGDISTSVLGDYLANPPSDFDLSLLSGRRSRRSLNSANFGGIVGSQMQMAGQVNMVIRGSDLVGVMNRTNTTINRVG